MAVRVPPDMFSRAYLKMHEALLWSRFPIQSGDTCMEIGSSPGGAAQALLSKGLHVIGVDPAEMHPSLLAHPRFTHLRRRGTDVKHRDFRSVNWLVVDANIASERTLNMVESIVSLPHVDLRGLLLTVKLRDWNLAKQIPAYVQRVRSWGFESVRARQLAFNKQEICIAAMRKRSMRRGPKKSFTEFRRQAT